MRTGKFLEVKERRHFGDQPALECHETPSPMAHKNTIVHYHYPKGILIISRRRVSGSNQMELEEAQFVHIESLFRISFCALSERSLALLYCIYVAHYWKTQVLSIASKLVHRCTILRESLL